MLAPAVPQHPGFDSQGERLAARVARRSQTTLGQARSPLPSPPPSLGGQTLPPSGCSSAFRGGTGRFGLSRRQAGKDARWEGAATFPSVPLQPLARVGLPGTWLPSFASSRRQLADEPGADGTWSSHRPCCASLAPAVRGEGRAGLPPAPHPPLRGRLGGTPRDGWMRPWQGPAMARDASAGCGHGDERPDEDGNPRLGCKVLAQGCAMAGRAGAGLQVAVPPPPGRAPIPADSPRLPQPGAGTSLSRAGIVLPEAGRDRGGFGTFASVPLRSVLAPSGFAFPWPQRQSRSPSWGSHPALPIVSPGIRIW